MDAFIARLSERERVIFGLRETIPPTSYDRIGALIGGISGGRVSQIYARIKRQQKSFEKYQSTGEGLDYLELPTQIRNALYTYGYHRVDELVKAVKEGMPKIKNLGLVGWSIIINRLVKKGHLTKASLQIKEYKKEDLEKEIKAKNQELEELINQYKMTCCVIGLRYSRKTLLSN